MRVIMALKVVTAQEKHGDDIGNGDGDDDGDWIADSHVNKH